NDVKKVLDRGRIGIGALAVGLGRASLETATAYAKERKQFGRPIAEFEMIQWKLALARTELDAARLLVHRAAWLADRAESFSIAASKAKLFASEAASRAANDEPRAADILRELYPKTGRARIVGVTGPPGGGKSTLVNRLAGAYREQGERVAIVAVDPSSPFSGGALLGDRIRMQERALDEGLFIRSMASRGHAGGLARTTARVVNVLDAIGYSVVLVETVGVGQEEVDVVRV